MLALGWGSYFHLRNALRLKTLLKNLFHLAHRADYDMFVFSVLNRSIASASGCIAPWPAT